MKLRHIFAGFMLVVMILEPLLARASRLRVDCEQAVAIQTMGRA